MRVAIVDESVPFPYGSASSTRLRLLGQAVRFAGGSPSVLVIRPVVPEAVSSLEHVPRVGTYRGVPYEYLSGVSSRPRDFVPRQVLKAVGYGATVSRLIRLRSAGKLDVILLYTRQLTTIRAFGALARMLRVPLVLEVCEWPLAQVQTRGGNERAARRFCEYAFDHVDGVVAISTYIRDAVEARARLRGRQVATTYVPALVDTEAIVPASPSTTGRDVVLCVSLDYRSMVDSSLRAFSLAANALPKSRFVIVGGLTQAAHREWLDARIRELGLGGRVVVHGYLSDEILARTYRDAFALLAPLEDTPQSRSRFPTKIAEYLAAGRPVITSPIGDLPEYLTHRQNVLFTPSGEPHDVAGALVSLLADPDLAERIGRGARDAALRSFDYRVHAGNLVALLQTAQCRRPRFPGMRIRSPGVPCI